MTHIFARNLAPRLAENLNAFRVVTLGGARQSGKTTMVATLPGVTVVSLDDPATLGVARTDPVGLIESSLPTTAIDEFQRGGEDLVLAVKHRVDRQPERGQFLLTGSANYLANRSISETLAGRIARMTLWPLSLGERTGITETFLDLIFDREAWPPTAPSRLDRDAVAQLVVQGGYPEPAVQEMSARIRRLWFDSYVEDVVSREALRSVGGVRSEGDLRRVLQLLAARAPGELVMTDLARDAGLHRDTASSYVSLLQALYLVVLVPAWASDATTRAKRHPKILITDSGLLAHLRGVDSDVFAARGDARSAGDLFESFVVAELHKQAGWSARMIDLFHFRDRNGAEVDAIAVDRRTQEVAGVEIKWTATPRPDHARHLVLLRDRLGDRFTVGVVIHGGTQVLRLTDRVWAVPAGCLARNDVPSAAATS